MHSKFRQTARGFTLLELMITVTILGILAVVALVSYKVYMRRARATEAKQLLMETKMKQEQYFSTYSQYVDAGTESAPFPTTRPKLDGGADDLTMWDWTSDCPNATQGSAEEGFCHLGMKPGKTSFQLMTAGWAPGDAAPTSNYAFVGTLDTTQRWFYAVAFGDQDGDGKKSAFIMHSQSNEIIVDCDSGSDDDCEVE